MPHTLVVYLAIAAAVASMLLTGWKIWSDREFRKARLSFERTERAVRENYERNETLKRETFEKCMTAAAHADKDLTQNQWQVFETFERERREAFETSERTLRIRFMAQQDRGLTDAAARIKREIESYIQLEKWREGSWQRNLFRLEEASRDLAGTTSGLVSLIDEGPYYNDARMIQETARVLDVFGDFQTSVGHFAMPGEMQELSTELISHVTKILLSLSPSQKVRKSDDRKALLLPLRAELKIMSDQFIRKCGDFERDPSAFFAAADLIAQRMRPDYSNPTYSDQVESPVAK
jgi:hypothetical protein